MYTYRQILKQAIKIAWENPIFWFFGFFLALLGSGNELEVFFGSYGFGGQGIFLAILQGIGATELFTPAGIQELTRSIFLHPVYVFVLAIIFLLMMLASLLIIWLTIVSQSAIIGNSVSTSRNKPMNFSQGFALGLKYFWPILGLNLIVKAVVISLVMVIGLAVILDLPFKILFVLLFDLCIFVIIAVSFLVRLAICGVILKEWRLKESLVNAFDLIKKYWLVLTEITILLFLVTALANGFLSFLISQLIYYTLKNFYAYKLILLLVFGVCIIFFIFLQTVIIVFQWSTWALTFELITGKKPVLFSRLNNLLKRK